MRNRTIGTCVAILSLVAGCGSSSSGGGTPGSGGQSAGTGGSPSTSTGGTVGSGSGGAQAGTGGGVATGSGGAAPGTGGTVPRATGGAPAGVGGGAGAAGGRGGAPVVGTGGTTTGTGTLTFVTTPATNGYVLTGTRATATPLPSRTVQLMNGGTAQVMVTALALGGPMQTAFRLTGLPALPAMLAPGASLSATLEVMTTGATLPAPPMNPRMTGSTVVNATLTATAGAVTAQTNVWGMILATAINECTLGQILTTLGYKLNVGAAQDNANPNTSMNAVDLPKVEAGTDEIAAPLFVKAGTGMVTLTPVARFSPEGLMPFGWYPRGMPGMRMPVATMAAMNDAQTSNKARMVLPPVTGLTSFDPGTATFGVWVYTDQVTGMFVSATNPRGNAANGDYNYSEDGPNTPANTHRTKVYPLKDAAGVVVPRSYLLAVEEAGNGDYQDYVFVLSNVMPAM